MGEAEHPAAERFRYLYSEDELRGWVEPVRALAEQAEQVHVLMNNCYRDYAVRNARQLAALMAQPRADSVPAAMPHLPLTTARRAWDPMVTG